MTKNSTTYYYRYDDQPTLKLMLNSFSEGVLRRAGTGQRIYKDASTVKEFYLRDASGNTLAVYDMNTNKIKLANIFGNGGMIGRVGVTWSGSTRTDTRYYYTCPPCVWLVKDHLGSTRLEFDRYANVSSAFAYYAYGAISASHNNSNPNDKYKFTGKERDTETNYDYFGARYYDSDLGHWMSVDSLAVKYPGWSPYNYTLGNPVNLIDPDGNSPGDYYDEDFNYLGNDGEDDDKVYITSSETITDNKDKEGNVNWKTVANQSDYLGTANNVFITSDPITNSRILGLDPAIRGKATLLVNKQSSLEGITIRISSGFRTFAEQDALYAQGRTTPGKIVTNAKGGESIHNYGLAFDIVGIRNNKAAYNINWKRAGSYGKSIGLKWGGNFKSIIDKPHFQLSLGKH